jgi:uncharacterized protein YoxC
VVAAEVVMEVAAVVAAVAAAVVAEVVVAAAVEVAAVAAAVGTFQNTEYRNMVTHQTYLTTGGHNHLRDMIQVEVAVAVAVAAVVAELRLSLQEVRTTLTRNEEKRNGINCIGLLPEARLALLKVQCKQVEFLRR